MPMSDATKSYLSQAIIGESVTPFDNANAHIGVGDSSNAFNGSHTDLQGTSVRKPMRPGYPQRNSNVLTFEARFEEEVANFTWQEMAVFNADVGGLMLNRIVENLGEKSGEIWDLEITTTLLRGAVV